ncbi:FAD-dependent oxidoreductase [Aspergillus brunneoviolaceus CBS 621.78]|uniref:Isoamyl alcohol oxidase n=1 Tax=Aspergillus brunneoviolaceus CBS 621.78 TaxID=1450534 RepID=A0ACD1G1F7_9EURO|nr:isoamyl alcohol oxidase [Aspergillus brunneoviolaceus CBS 621.78]RAH43074.1 isoamyl alcohol oxidase [Aspergillus brunneoviolaceus CBS 621.78]
MVFRTVLLALLLGTAAAEQSNTTSSQCRCMPSDPCWPTTSEWSHFNSTVGGRLIKTVPLAAPCFDPNYNAADCQYLRDEWTQPALHDASSSSIMAAAVANESCDPFAASTGTCRLGNMVSYAVNVSSPAEIAQTIAYAAEKNIRLVIRNTGHDYMGKSTGAGGLSIWTHHLKNITVHDYSSPHYTGPAVTIGAGVQGEEVYAALHKSNLIVVGGECATVGPAGGYTQGGGHSALSSHYGLAADQTLEWEVVDGQGRQLRASPTENADLYWALSGGGGGTYGVVTSMTVKVFPDFPTVGVVLEFAAQDASDLDPFYQAVEYYHSLVPSITAAGGMAIARVMNASFLLTPLTLPNATLQRALDLLSPLTAKLDSLNITYAMNLTHSPSYVDHYNTLIEPNPTQLVENGQYGGKLIPLEVIEKSNANLTAAVRSITQDGAVFVSIALNVSAAVTGPTNNSVLPSWRTAAMDVILSTSWPDHANLGKMKQLADQMTQKWVPTLEALTSDPGCYMNEADPQQPNWKEAFYGPNYNRLLAIKKQYDPQDSFYAWTAVGSDNWVQEADGRLCRATSS